MSYRTANLDLIKENDAHLVRPVYETTTGIRVLVRGWDVPETDIESIVDKLTRFASVKNADETRYVVYPVAGHKQFDGTWYCFRVTKEEVNGQPFVVQYLAKVTAVSATSDLPTAVHRFGRDILFPFSASAFAQNDPVYSYYGLSPSSESTINGWNNATLEALGPANHELVGRTIERDAETGLITLNVAFRAYGSSNVLFIDTAQNVLHPFGNSANQNDKIYRYVKCIEGSLPLVPTVSGYTYLQKTEQYQDDGTITVIMLFRQIETTTIDAITDFAALDSYITQDRNILNLFGFQEGESATFAIVFPNLSPAAATRQACDAAVETAALRSTLIDNTVRNNVNTWAPDDDTDIAFGDLYRASDDSGDYICISAYTFNTGDDPPEDDAVHWSLWDDWSFETARFSERDDGTAAFALQFKRVTWNAWGHDDYEPDLKEHDKPSRVGGQSRLTLTWIGIDLDDADTAQSECEAGTNFKAYTTGDAVTKWDVRLSGGFIYVCTTAHTCPATINTSYWSIYYVLKVRISPSFQGAITVTQVLAKMDSSDDQPEREPRFAVIKYGQEIEYRPTPTDGEHAQHQYRLHYVKIERYYTNDRDKAHVWANHNAADGLINYEGGQGISTAWLSGAGLFGNKDVVWGNWKERESGQTKYVSYRCIQDYRTSWATANTTTTNPKI